MGLFEDTRLTINLISTPSAPFGSKTIVSLSILALEASFAWELLKIQLTLNSKTWVNNCKFFFPWHVFTINDGNKLDLVSHQSMQCAICHYVLQTYSSSSTTKNRKGLITYN